jgi:threonylcarbamoyladenosine tRNA methylthiotransferase MtaB
MTGKVATSPEEAHTAPRVSFFTLGCRLNQYDTAALRAGVRAEGLEETDASPDVIVVNTCTVTRRADQEARQLVRRLHRESPGARIVVTGCYAQRAPEELRALPGVTAVLGAAEREDRDALRHALRGSSAGAVGPGRTSRSFGTSAPLHVGRSRALLKIQDGCDSFCTYCVVPYVRGRSRSLPAAEALERARRLIESGFHEIVLTGADLGDYDALPALVIGILALGDGHRVRLSSIEPNKLHPDLVAMIGTEPRLCRHLHLPLQSGSNRILRAMRRGYAREDYARLLERVVRKGPVGIGADVIVGFPGEGEAEFQETFDFLAEAPVTFLHVFRYSSRPGTAATRLPVAVPDPVVRERAERLRVLGDAKARAFRRSFLGTTLPVVMERGVGRRGRVAMSDVYVPVEVEREEGVSRGAFEVRIHDEEGDRLVGSPIASSDQHAPGHVDLERIHDTSAHAG